MKLIVLLLLGASGFAQSNRILTTDIHEMNHGGWGSVLNIGADVGDSITLDVTCDHSDPGGHGICLYSPPAVQSCSGFQGHANQLVRDHQAPSCQVPIALDLVFSEFRHQIYRISSPSTGDQFIETQYWWVGDDVHYFLHVTNWEINNL